MHMNVLAPVSTLMSKKLITVNPEDRLTEVKRLFEEHQIHHILVVRHKTLVGLISQTDLMHFMRGFVHSAEDQLINEARLHAFRAKEIMTERLAKIESGEPIRTALEVFKINRFHALPVVDQEELVGIITTHDIIKELADAPISLGDYHDKE